MCACSWIRLRGRKKIEKQNDNKIYQSSVENNKIMSNFSIENKKYEWKKSSPTVFHVSFCSLTVAKSKHGSKWTCVSPASAKFLRCITPADSCIFHKSQRTIFYHNKEKWKALQIVPELECKILHNDQFHSHHNIYWLFSPFLFLFSFFFGFSEFGSIGALDLVMKNIDNEYAARLHNPSVMCPKLNYPHHLEYVIHMRCLSRLIFHYLMQNWFLLPSGKRRDTRLELQDQQ